MLREYACLVSTTASLKPSTFRLAAVVLLAPALRWPLARRPSCCCSSVCHSRKSYPVRSSLRYHTSRSLSFASLLPHASTSICTNYLLHGSLPGALPQCNPPPPPHPHSRSVTELLALCSVTSHRLQGAAAGSRPRQSEF